MGYIKCVACFFFVIMVLYLSSCSKETPIQPQPQPETLEIHLINEIYQRGNHGESLEIPVSVKITNTLLQPVEYVPVTFQVTDGVRIDFASLAEISLMEIMDKFDIENGSELGILDTNSKVKIYTRKNFDEQPRQYTFSYGFLLYGEDSEWMNIWYPGGYVRFYNEMKHEVMHMVQYLMGVHYHMCDDWFMESIAEEISGGAFRPITTSEQLETWLANPTYSVNPIDIHTTDDYPPPYLETSGRYYPMFHLIMSYLLSEKGLGKDYADVKNMFEEIAVTNHFSQAFYSHMGISTEDLKVELYERLRTFIANE